MLKPHITGSLPMTVLVSLGLWLCHCERSPKAEQRAPQADAPATAQTETESTASAPATAEPKYTKQELKLEGPEPEMLAHLSPQWNEEGQLDEGLGIEPGKPVPPTSFTDIYGKKFSLPELAKQGPLGVLFYRGGWDPYANYQLRAIAARGYHFGNLGAKLVLVSVDSPKAMKRTHRQHGLGQMGLDVYFVSDSDLKLHRAFNVAHQLDAEELAQLKKQGHDIQAASGRQNHTVSNPAFFVIGEDGQVELAHALKNPKNLIAAVQIIKVLTASAEASEP